jgi:hypothetical protein
MGVLGESHPRTLRTTENRAEGALQAASPGRNEKEGVFIEKKLGFPVQVSKVRSSSPGQRLSPLGLKALLWARVGMCARAHSAIFSLLCKFASKAPFLT